MLVVQEQALIDAGHPSTLIIALTTNLIDDAEPLRVRVHTPSSLRRDSDLLIDQLRAIDNRVLVKGPLSRLDEATMERATDALREVLELA